MYLRKEQSTLCNGSSVHSSRKLIILMLPLFSLNTHFPDCGSIRARVSYQPSSISYLPTSCMYCHVSLTISFSLSNSLMWTCTQAGNGVVQCRQYSMYFSVEVSSTVYTCISI